MTVRSARSPSARPCTGWTGLTVTEAAVEYPEELDLDQIVGNVHSAMSPEWLPADRPGFAARIDAAIGPFAPFTHRVEVLLLVGRT